MDIFFASVPPDEFDYVTLAYYYMWHITVVNKCLNKATFVDFDIIPALCICLSQPLWHCDHLSFLPAEMTFITTAFRETQVWHSHTSKSINYDHQGKHSWLIIIFNIYFSTEIELNVMFLSSNASQFILTAGNIYIWTLLRILYDGPQRAEGKEMTFDSFQN